jgi:hypothetical protein
LVPFAGPFYGRLQTPFLLAQVAGFAYTSGALAGSGKNAFNLGRVFEPVRNTEKSVA